MRTAFAVILFFFSIVFMLQVYQQGTTGSYTSVSIQGNVSGPGYTGGAIVGGPSLGSVAPSGINNCPNQIVYGGLRLGQCPQSGLSSWTGSLLFITVTAALIFTALGIFAGGFGFGLHAPTLVTVSLMVSVVIYINLVILSQFSSIPSTLWLVIDGFFTVLLVIGIMDTLQPTKVGG